MLNLGRARGRRRVGAVAAAIALGVAVPLVSAIPAAADPDRQDQRAAAVPSGMPELAPIDPQNWERPQHMTWDDYRPVPGTDWTDPSLEPSVRTFKGALVVGDFPGRSFVVSQPNESTIFGNPQGLDAPVPREEVPQFYEDFLNKPGELNHGHTIDEYWMENSSGRYGVDLESFGPYRLDGKQYEYFVDEFGNECPEKANCDRNFQQELAKMWREDVGKKVADQFDFVFFMSAGQDESSSWQEFGEMMFPDRQSVSDEFGPPMTLEEPNWQGTRYIEWTSWASASTVWAHAGEGYSVQAESSGPGTYAHEFAHILGIADNYNNPYGDPLSRSYTGPWSMLSRGSFNGPGGPHTRWHVPSDQGGSMGSHFMLRNKLELDLIGKDRVLQVNRESLDSSGVVIADVTAREISPGENGLSGIKIAMNSGDHSSCEWPENYRCDRGGYNNYTVEVVDRMGFDSFTPDSGVLLTKTKNKDRPPYMWVIDANPQDIDLVDFTRPDGSAAKVSLGDYRQLSDALFHAGARSGSEYEWVDKANRLHFYILDVRRDDRGVLSYRVAVRSLDGSGPHQRGVELAATGKDGLRPGKLATCTFDLSNTGETEPVAGEHPDDVSEYVDGDVYRLQAETSGKGWNARLKKKVVAAETGDSMEVPVYVLRERGRSPQTTVTLTATSESDGSVSQTATCDVHVRDTVPENR